MPQVPYSPVPQISPANQGQPSVQVNAPGAAFGENIAQAVGHLGQVGENVGNELFQRAIALQQLANETEAKEADAKYMLDVGKLHAEYSSLQGKAAVDAYPKYARDVQDLRQQHRAGLSNDMSRRMFDSAALSTMSRTIFNGAGHAATQNKAWAMGTSQALVEARTDAALQNPKDWGAFEQGKRDVEAEIHTQAGIAGWGPEQTTQKIAEAHSRMEAARIRGLADTQPALAKQLLEANRGSLREQDFERVSSVVTSRLDSVGARMVEQEVNADLREDPLGSKKSERERIDEGREKASRITDDPRFLDAVDQRIRAGFNIARAQKRDADYQNYQTVLNGVVGGSGNVKPTNEDELTAQGPRMQAAWDALPEERKRSARAYMAQNAKGDFTETKEKFDRYMHLRGMSISDDPTQREEFFGMDLQAEQLPHGRTIELSGRQEKMRQHSTDDPRVTRAMNILVNSGIAPTDKTSQTGYRGRLAGALEVWAEQNKTKPNPSLDEIKQIGATLRREMPGTGYFGSNFGQDELWQVQVPKDFEEAAKAQNPGYSDDAIQHLYAKMRFREEFNRLHGAKKETK